MVSVGVQASGAVGERRPHRVPRPSPRLSRGHLERVLDEYVRHYNEARPHRALQLDEPRPTGLRAPAGPIRRRDVLNGLIHEYARCLNRRSPTLLPSEGDGRDQGVGIYLTLGALSPSPSLSSVVLDAQWSSILAARSWPVAPFRIEFVDPFTLRQRCWTLQVLQRNDHNPPDVLGQPAEVANVAGEHRVASARCAGNYGGVDHVGSLGLADKLSGGSGGGLLQRVH